MSLIQSFVWDSIFWASLSLRWSFLDKQRVCSAKRWLLNRLTFSHILLYWDNNRSLFLTKTVFSFSICWFFSLSFCRYFREEVFSLSWRRMAFSVGSLMAGRPLFRLGAPSVTCSLVATKSIHTLVGLWGAIGSAKFFRSYVSKLVVDFGLETSRSFTSVLQCRFPSVLPVVTIISLLAVSSPKGPNAGKRAFRWDLTEQSGYQWIMGTMVQKRSLTVVIVSMSKLTIPFDQIFFLSESPVHRWPVERQAMVCKSTDVKANQLSDFILTED